MKPMQWAIAFGVLVVMVFVITFAMNYLGSARSPDDKPNPGGDGSRIILAFDGTQFPRSPNPQFKMFTEGELHRPGHHDYLFANTTDQPVKVGRMGKTCTCSSLQLYLATDEWKKEFSSAMASTEISASLNPLTAVGFAAALDKRLGDATARVPQTATLDLDMDHKLEWTTIPPGAAGWFRMEWNGTKPGPFAASLWAGRQGEQDIALEANVRLLDPVVLKDKDIDFSKEPIIVSKSEQGPSAKPAVLHTVKINLWSATRTTLHPKAALISKWGAEKTPVEIGAAERTSDDSSKPPDLIIVEGQPTTPLCTYTIPVKLLDRSPDGKYPFPYGGFRIRVKVTFDDKDIDPVVCSITGRINGDIWVRSSDNEPDRLAFSSFQKDEGSQSRSIQVFSDVPGIKLEIDDDRTPPFLKGCFEPPKLIERNGNDSVWEVTGRIKGGRVFGAFPSMEIEDFFDSAVYIKAVGDSTRSLRISVSGNATDR
jgi:hypothetical protein